MQDLMYMIKYLVRHTPGYVFVKDKSSRYLYANKPYMTLNGINSLDEIIGELDESRPGLEPEICEVLREQDQKVMNTEKELLILDIYPYNTNEWRIFLTTKTPLYSPDSNEVIGTIGSLTDLSKFRLVPTLLNKMLSITPSTDNNHSKLSKRQKEILVHMMGGRTAKEIAKDLDLSPRTVDVHINNLKLMFNCERKSEIIYRAIASGFLHDLTEVVPRCRSSIELLEC